MARLNTHQIQNARLIYGEGVKAGLPPNRALELVAAAYAESGLREHATNKSSGAAGFFQLLSSGYVNRANQLGGVYNPMANIHAILPDYVRYWKTHPNAAPGEAGAAVERSGMGPGFYAAPLRILGKLTPPSPVATPEAPTPGPSATPPANQLQPYQDPQALQAQQLAEQQALVDALTGLMNPTRTKSGSKDFSAGIQGIRDISAARDMEIPMIHPLPSTSLPQQGSANAPMQAAAPSQGKATSADGVAWEGVAGPHGTSGPRKVDSRLIALAHHFGLQITSGYRSVAKQAEIYAHRSSDASVAKPGHSNHNKGLAIDVSPSEKAKAFLHWAFQHPQFFSEVFYDPAGISIKNGKIVHWTIGGHSNHIHIAIAP